MFLIAFPSQSSNVFPHLPSVLRKVWQWERRKPYQLHPQQRLGMHIWEGGHWSAGASAALVAIFAGVHLRCRAFGSLHAIFHADDLACLQVHFVSL